MTGPDVTGDPGHAGPARGPVDARVEGYLRRLRAGLSAQPGDPTSGDVLDELRDHLLCHVEDQVADGLDAEVAARRAVAELGSAAGLAAALRVELVRPHLRRLSVLLLLLGFGCGATWTGVLLAGPPEPWTERTEPAPILFFDIAGELAGTGTLLAAVLGVLLVAWPGRYLPHPGFRAGCQRWAVRACLASLGLGLVTGAQLAGYLLVRGLIAPWSLSWPAVLVTGLISLAAGAALRGPLHSLVALRHR